MSKNDDKILDLKAQIEKKKRDIGIVRNFNPSTNCILNIDNVNYNIHTFSKSQIIHMLVKLNSMMMSAKDLGLEDQLEFNGYNISLWIEDLMKLLNITNIRQEQVKLMQMEKRLTEMLSDNKKIELELDEIMKEL